MKKYLAVFLAALGLAAPVQAEQVQETTYQSRTLEIADVNRIRVNGAFLVMVVVREGASEVRLSGPAQLLSDAIAEVEGDTLSIRFSEGAPWSWNPGSGMHVVVNVPELVGADVEGSGSLEIVRARGDRFAAATTGSGTIELRDLDVGMAEFATYGSGGIIADGIARDGTYSVNGSGSIDAKRLRVANAEIAAGGSGSVYADVSDRANVMLASSGSVDIVGGAECIAQDRGAGRIECR